MNEDERYRTSSQYRLWSYTPDSLAKLRSTTNRVAAERVRAAIQRARASRATSASASGDTSEAEQNGPNSRAVSIDPGSEVNCLTVEEELKLVTFYCRQTLDLGDHLKVPTDVKVRPLHPTIPKCFPLPHIEMLIGLVYDRQQQSNTSNASTSLTPL
jgi:cyclin H